MATSVKKKVLQSSPRVKFRWCRTVPCQTKEIYLILTSITGAQVNLRWKKELGWYESDIVSLPCGLHSGFLLIREEIKPSTVRPQPTDESLIDERDYKIDPFFITPHKFSVELFVQSSRTAGIWESSQLLRERYLSSHDLNIDRDEKKSGGSAFSPRKWSSDQELRKSVNWDISVSDGERITNKNNGRYTNLRVDSSTKSELSNTRSSELRVNVDCDIKIISPSRSPTATKWKSTKDKSPCQDFLLGDESSHYLRNRSLQIETVSHGDEGISVVTTVSSSPIDTNEKELKSDIFSRYIKTKESSLLPTVTSLSYSDLKNLKLETLSQTQVVESLLIPSDDEEEPEEPTSVKTPKTELYFKEINPPKTEGYGCLITFESRSTSMDDLGSPRALEDVLVSLTSSDTEPKPFLSNLSKEAGIITKEFITEEEKENFVPTGKRLESEDKFIDYYSDFSEQSQEENEVCDRSLGEEEIRNSDTEITINEDENFQYDSLKHDDHKIPINFKDGQDSEVSSEFSVLREPSQFDTQSKSNVLVISDKSQSHKGFYNLEISNKKSAVSSHQSSLEESERKPVTRSYDFAERNRPSSADGAVATEHLFLVHPGSLRSESGNGNVETSPKGEKVVSTRESKVDIYPSPGIHKSKQFRSRTVIRKVDPPGLVSSNLERIRATKKVKRSSSPNKTILIIRDKRPPRMNSTGTQTSYRASAAAKHSLVAGNRTIPLASKYKENIYSPLPNKANGPWNCKHLNENERSQYYPYSDNNHIKNLQRNLYNLTKANEILHKIHPFDYRPTIIHRQTPSEAVSSSSSEVLRPKHRFRSSRTNHLRFKTSSGPPSAFSSPVPQSHYERRWEPVSTIPRSTTSFRYDRDIPVSSYSPTRLKRVPNPRLSIYGKEVIDWEGPMTNSLSRHTRHLSITTSPPKSSTSFVFDASRMRPTSSLPDLRATRDEGFLLNYRTNLKEYPSRAYSSPPAYALDCDLEKRNVSSRPRFFGTSRRKSLEERPCTFSGSSGDSTDSLIDEAEDISRKHSEGRWKPRLYDASPSKESFKFRRRRTKSSTEPHPFETDLLSSPMRLESSVSEILRTRSETDLRMVGKLAGGYQGEPPYLPYRKDQLSIGQIVKVLVPGEGVAMARVVYAPVEESFSNRRRHSANQDITVVLISEPTNLAGSVITVPLNKVLLAWPK